MCNFTCDCCSGIQKAIATGFFGGISFCTCRSHVLASLALLQGTNYGYVNHEARDLYGAALKLRNGQERQEGFTATTTVPGGRAGANHCAA